MFEVEQNFNLTAQERDRLLEGAEFRHEKTFTDTYFDTAAYALTAKDRWLRRRDDRYELKEPMDMSPDGMTDQYLEIEDASDIRKALLLPSDGTMETILGEHGYLPFCTCTTTRKTYLKEGFTIVFDHVTYPGCAWTFDACEIELLVGRREQMPDAAKRITDFASRNALRSGYIPGKVIAYLAKERPEHFEALAARGVVKRP